MFASQDIGSRKVFQKPNILRRKTTRKRKALLCESPEDKLLYREQITDNKSINSVKLLAKVADYPERSLIHKEIDPGTQERVQQAQVAPGANFLSFTIHNVAANSEIHEPKQIHEDISQSLSENQHENSLIKQEYSVTKSSLLRQQVDYNEGKPENSLNVESFLLNSQKNENAMPNDTQLTGKKTETEVENKWCLNFMSDDSKDMVMPNFYDMAQIKISRDDKNKNTKVTSFSKEINSLQETANVSEKEMIIQSCLNSRVVKYKCDVPNCNKSFWNEARLQKHKLIHSRQKTPNVSAIIECPVKKVDSNGVEQQCGHFFLSREMLMKHLNEDHVPEDAAHKCDSCERRFWWATGLRTHAQSRCTRALVCSWPGCGRVFRQPCRLREHARAHTGDRPYPCNYPNCDWAFRSASKLVRHARRHTGERRHECAACGRTFPRREHLRDHAVRYHAPRTTHACTHEGCEQTFAQRHSLFLHMKRVHKIDTRETATKRPASPTISATPNNADSPNETNAKTPKKIAKAPQNPTAEPEIIETTKMLEPKENDGKKMLLMTLDGGALLYGIGDSTFTLSDAIETSITHMIKRDAELVVNDFSELTEQSSENQVDEVKEDPRRYVYDLEGRCARTHCTWPLEPTELQPEFIMEEDAQVEQPETAENNIYTVRSDLFLHGNVMINEDSEFTIRESSNRATEAEEVSNAGQLDALDLIDAHPTIDLMQEELMYADAAVDESSFRVFMMNGELS